MPCLPDEHQNEQVRRRECCRAVDNQARIPGIELVLRVAREPPVQPRVDDHEYVKPKQRPVPDFYIRVCGEPQEYGEERDVDEDEGTTSRLIRHRAQDEKEPPLVFMDCIEFVGNEAREREVEEEVGGSSHRRLWFEERSITKVVPHLAVSRLGNGHGDRIS